MGEIFRVKKRVNFFLFLQTKFYAVLIIILDFAGHPSRSPTVDFLSLGVIYREKNLKGFGLRVKLK